MRPAFVTGIGVLSAAGAGRSAFASAVQRGAVPSQTVEVLDPTGRARRVRVARMPAYDARDYLPASRLRRMGDESLAPVVAAMLAERDAVERGADTPVPPERRGMILGTGLGPLKTTGVILDLLQREGPAGAEPFLFIESLHNSPAGHAAIVLECKGPTVTPVAGDASALVALLLGAQLIQERRADQVYAGGSDEISDFFLKQLSRLVPPGREIPLLGAGAALFRVEGEPRGTSPYARIAGFAVGHDPSARGADYGTDPTVPAGVLERTLRRAGWRREDVDLLVLADNGFPRLRSLERQVYSTWPANPAAGSFRRQTPARVFGALAGSGGFAITAAALSVERGESKKALICLPSWGGGCQALALSTA